MSPGLARIVTVGATSLLAFDGAALIALGWWSERILLVLVGAVCFLSSGLVLLYWCWYRRRLGEIAGARRELRDEAQELQRLLGKR